MRKRLPALWTTELWVTDGTAEGTELVADIAPGIESSGVRPLAVVGSYLLLSAFTQDLGGELWRTAGRGSGAELVKDLSPGPAHGMGFLVPLAVPPYTDGEQFLFFAQDVISGSEPWLSDGTPEGTRQLVDLNPGPKDSSFFGNYFGCAVLDQHWIFQATDPSHGREFHTSDGTAQGTELLVDLDRQTSSLRQVLFLLFGESAPAEDRVFFNAQDSVHGSELWVTDGTAPGSHLVIDLMPGTEAGVEGFHALPEKLWFDGEMYFVGSDGVHGRELWATDGSEAGTRLVHDLEPGPADSHPRAFALFQDRLAFGAESGVWWTDGKAAPVQLSAGGLPSDLTPAADLLYFVADCSLQLYDAASGFARQLTVPTLGTGTCAHSLALADAGRQADVVGERRSDHLRLFFVTGSITAGSELWVHDELEGGARRVRDIRPGEASSMVLKTQRDGPRESLIARLDSRVLLLADDGLHGTEL